jgi:sulfur-carrier protein adenylyltransferase/sulfurtransferase
MEMEERLDPGKARELIASNEVMVLDIRGDEEWREKRIAGSKQVDADEIDSALEDLDDDRAVLIVCEDGKRSAELAAKLREDGRDAACIEGGIDAWESEKLAMQPSDDVSDDAVV